MTIHVLAAVLWLGGMFFLAAVGAPVLRTVEPAALRAELFRRLGLRFRTFGWWAIAVLLVTGMLNLHFRGVLEGGTWRSAEFWETPWGRTLSWKVGGVALMLAIQAVHDFGVGPRASAAAPGTPAAVRLRRRAALLARASAVAGLIVLLAAIRLTRGG